jgi:hypothetical protein
MDEGRFAAMAEVADAERIIRSLRPAARVGAEHAGPAARDQRERHELLGHGTCGVTPQVRSMSASDVALRQPSYEATLHVEIPTATTH